VADTLIDLTVDWEKGTVNQKLARLPEEITEDGMLAINDGADFFVMVWKNNALVDTGTYQKSIRKQRTKDQVISVRAGGYFVNPKTGRICDYASYLEANYHIGRISFEMVRSYIINLIRTKVVEAAGT